MVAQTVERLRTRLAELVAGLRARIRRSSWGERALVGGSAAVLFALLFLPWLTTSCDADCNGFGLAARTIDGVHGWGLLTLVGLLAGVGLWAVRCHPDRVTLPALPLRDPQVYMLAGTLELVGVVLFWFEFHASVASFVSVGVRPTVGWFLAFAGATATLLGGWLLQSERLTSG
ncbi:MAG TPA: hypothetical protein VGP96_16245 [Candidatus Dormibacteraeota bacterium]|nr:hypothetical protein [Candidatus Dormibacteraeota bacterium]